MEDFKLYPKWKYHATKPAVTVADETAEAALGSGWADTPAAFLTETQEESVLDQIENLIHPKAAAKSAGVKRTK